MDIDEYSIPKISKCFIGDTIDRVELGSGAENLPADLDAEEVKFSDNGPSSNLEKEEVRSIAPLLETTDQLHTHDASGTSGPIIQEDHNHEIVPATSHESNDSSIPSKPILPEAASATSAPTEISPSIPDEEESPQVEQVSYSAIRPVEPLTAPMMLRGWMKKQGHMVKNWKTRYFVLEEGLLSYYVDQRDVTPYGADRKGRVCLAGYRYLDELEELDGGHGRKASSESGGVIGLVARRISVGVAAPALADKSYKITLHKSEYKFDDYVAKVAANYENIFIASIVHFLFLFQNFSDVTQPETFIIALETSQLKSAWY